MILKIYDELMTIEFLILILNLLIDDESAMIDIDILMMN